MTSSTRHQSEALVSTTPIDYPTPLQVDLQNLFKEKKSKLLDVDRSSIIRLKRWAQQRFTEVKTSGSDQQSIICGMHYWDGYISAITEILEMEDQ